MLTHQNRDKLLEILNEEKLPNKALLDAKSRYQECVVPIKLYRRKTHINGVYRKEMEEIWNKIPANFRCLIHDLDSEKWMSLYDIRVSIFDYAKCFPDENHVEYAVSEGLLKNTLELLINFDMVETNVQN